MYEGVTVKYIHGRTAVMTIYDEHHKAIEKVDLHVIKSKSKLHDIMKEKGFLLKSTTLNNSTSNKETARNLYDPMNGMPQSHPSAIIRLPILLRIAIVSACLVVLFRFYSSKFRRSRRNA
jgi:hypothetical protein